MPPALTTETGAILHYPYVICQLADARLAQNRLSRPSHLGRQLARFQGLSGLLRPRFLRPFGPASTSLAAVGHMGVADCALWGVSPRVFPPCVPAGSYGGVRREVR